MRFLFGHMSLKLIVGPLLIVAAVLAMFIVGTLRDERKAMLDQLDVQGELLAEAAASACVEGMLIMDYPALRTHAEGMTSSSGGVTFVQIVRDDGKVVAQAPDTIGEDLATTTRLYPSSIQLEDMVIGRVRVGLSTTPIERVIADRTKSLITSAASSFVIIALLLWLMLRRVVLKPLGSLTDQAQRLGGGDLETRVRLNRIDELGQLAGTLDQMRADLFSRNRALEAAVVRAEAAARAKTDFLANMSHEIRTPMTAILGYTDILYEAGCIEEAPPERVEALATVKRNGEHLLAIINDILDLSKMDAGKMEVECIRTNFIEIARDAIELMQIRAEEKQLKLSLDLNGPVPASIRSDPTRVRQILVNLVGNAIKFTPSGSVRMVLSHEAGEAVVRVIDTGIGMSDEQASLLFQPFQQADNTMSRKFGGTGLGLTISQRFAQLLGGTIEVESILGRGSTFTVRIATGDIEGVEMVEKIVPIKTPEQIAAATAKPAPKPPAPKPAATSDGPLSGLKVLLVEDGPDNQKLISFHLKKCGAQVRIADNGRIGVDLIMGDQGETFEADVVFMDMQMPVMDGYSAAAELRERGCKLPIVALTAHAMTGDRERCLEAGCDEYMTKPVNRKQLIEMALTQLGREVPAS